MVRQFSITNKGTKSEFFKLSVSDKRASQQKQDDGNMEAYSTHYVNGDEYQNESAIPVLSEEIMAYLVEDERERKAEE